VPEPYPRALRAKRVGAVPPQGGGGPATWGIVRAKRVGAEEAPHQEGRFASMSAMIVGSSGTTIGE
jgi:hypothetical protein